MATLSVTSASNPTGADAPNQPIADPSGGGIIKTEQPQEVSQEIRPTWLPEKFKSPEDMAKAYGELEKKIGKPKEVSEDVTPTEAPAELPTTFSKYSNEYFERGDISEESIKELEGKGIPREYVKQYIKGFEASQQSEVTSILGEIGGESEFKAMSSWASENLDEGELSAYNQAVSSGSKEQASFAVKGMFARYKSGGSREPRLLAGDTRASGATNVFRSTAEVVEAMKNPKYKSDPAYRKDVEERLASSNVFN
jgi:hypothetical protein